MCKCTSKFKNKLFFYKKIVNIRFYNYIIIQNLLLMELNIIKSYSKHKIDSFWFSHLIRTLLEYEYRNYIRIPWKVKSSKLEIQMNMRAKLENIMKTIQVEIKIRIFFTCIFILFLFIIYYASRNAGKTNKYQ